MSFDFDSLINFIQENKDIKNISLQFSPEFQKNFQEDFYEKIKSLLPKDKQIYIIGDTSYSSCCCDEATALHLKSDIIIRIGTGCFTQNKLMPIYYLIDNINFNEKNISQFFSDFFEKFENKIKNNNNFENIIFFYNEKFQKNFVYKIKDEFTTKIKEEYNKNIFFAEINIEDYNKETKNKKIYDEKDIIYGREIKPKMSQKIDKTFLIIYLGENNEEKLLYELSLRFSNIVNDILFISYTVHRRRGKSKSPLSAASRVSWFLVSVINAFYWSNRFVFIKQEEERRNLWLVFIKTLLAYGSTGIVLNSILLWLFIDKCRISEYLAPILILIITVPTNFLLNKYWSFKPQKENEEN